MRWLLLFVVFTGCSKDEKAPTCAEVTDHVLAMVQQAYPGHGDMGGRGNRQLEIDQCEARKVSAKERRCILAASDMSSVARCRAARVRQPDSPSTPPPAPVPAVPPVPAPATP